MMNDITQARYVGSDGPDPDDLAGNSVQHLAGHMFSPGHGLEDEPLDSAEKASQQTVQNAARSASQELANGQQDGAQNGATAPAFDLNDAAGQIRSSLRPGA